MGYNQKQSTIRLTINFACHCKNNVLFKAFLYSRETFYDYLITKEGGLAIFVDIDSFYFFFACYFFHETLPPIRRKLEFFVRFKEPFLSFLFCFCSYYDLLINPKTW